MNKIIVGHQPRGDAPLVIDLGTGVQVRRGRGRGRVRVCVHVIRGSACVYLRGRKGVCDRKERKSVYVSLCVCDNRECV